VRIVESPGLGRVVSSPVSGIVAERVESVQPYPRRRRAGVHVAL